MMVVITKELKGSNNRMGGVGNRISNKRIGFATIMFGLYTAMIPLNQIMNITGSGTLNKYLGIIVMAIILVSMLLKKQAFKFNREYIPFIVFIIFAFLSYFWSINQQTTLSVTIRLTSLIFFYIVFSNRVYTDSEKTFMKVCCIFGGLVVSLYLINTSDLYYTRVFLRTASGQEADPNDISSSLAFGGLFLYDYLLRTNKKLNGLVIAGCIAVFLYGMLLTGSRGGMLGLIMGAIMLTVWNVRKKQIYKARLFLLHTVIFILLVIIFGTGILSTYINAEVLERLTLNSILETGGTGRATIWMVALKTAFESPILGYGFGAGSYALYQNYATYVGTHNDILYILLGTGVIGLFIMSYCILRIVKFSVKKRDILTLSLMVMLVAFCGTLDYLLNKNFWNVMIYSQIGLGITHLEYNQSTMLRKSQCNSID